jgi:hypothetical protein
LHSQALASVLAARYFARAAKRPLGPKPWRAIFLQFSILMIVLMLGNIIQIVSWALIYSALAVAHRQKLSHRSAFPVPSGIGRSPALERSHHRSAHGLRGAAVQQRRCAQDCFYNDHLTGFLLITASAAISRTRMR